LGRRFGSGPSAGKRRTGNQHARYVFSLAEWLIEDTNAQECLIVTLKTTDGFEVSFGVPFEACRALGWSLQNEANKAIDASEPDEMAIGRTLADLN